MPIKADVSPQDIEMLDKLMAFLHKISRPLTRAGFGVEGTFPEWLPLIGGKGWKAWPFVVFAFCVMMLLVIDQWRG